eukprot:g45827.t1
MSAMVYVDWKLFREDTVGWFLGRRAVFCRNIEKIVEVMGLEGVSEDPWSVTAMHLIDDMHCCHCASVLEDVNVEDVEWGISQLTGGKWRKPEVMVCPEGGPGGEFQARPAWGQQVQASPGGKSQTRPTWGRRVPEARPLETGSETS